MPMSPGTKNTLSAQPDTVTIDVIVFIVVIVLIIVNVIVVIAIVIEITIDVKSVIVILALINVGDAINHIVSTAVSNKMCNNKGK